MNIRLALMAAAFWPVCAFSMGYPDLTSEIPGIQLWQLGINDPNERGFPEGYIGEENEFFQYCDGSRSIYVGSSNSPIRCQSKPDGHVVLYAKGNHLYGPVLVSKKPLPARGKALAVSADEIARLKEAEKVAQAAFRREHLKDMGLDAPAYVQAQREIVKTPTYRKYGGIRYKLAGPSGAIYISPIWLVPTVETGWDLHYAVFREIKGRLEKTGEIEGCIQGFRDLDEDGTPEVFTSTCEIGEGGSHEYWSLTPTVRVVVQYSAS